MPKISRKAELFPFSPIRKLVPFAEAAKKRGTKVYHLNIGQPDIPAPAMAIERLKERVTNDVAYTFSEGVHSYQQILADSYNKINIDVTTSDIIVTTGGSEAITFAMLSIFDEGGEVLIPEPFYANYNSFAIQAGVTVVPITASIENDFALPSIEEFEKKITDKTRAILICNPSNPTGYLYSKEELLKLKEIALKHDLYIISDEVYRDFCYDGASHLSIMEIEGLEQHAIMIDSVSKKFSMCGARVGAIICRNKELMSAVMRLAQARLCSPLFGQIAAEAAFAADEQYFNEVKAEYTKRRNFMVNALRNIPGCICPMPKGAFYVTVQLPVDDADKFAQWILEEFSYEGSTVMFAPASGFYATKGAGKQEARFAYVLEVSELEKAAKCLEKAIEAYNNR